MGGWATWLPVRIRLTSSRTSRIDRAAAPTIAHCGLRGLTDGILGSLRPVRLPASAETSGAP